jgi:hypothetical protein
VSEYDVDAGGLSERVEAEKPGASSLPLARTSRSENPPVHTELDVEGVPLDAKVGKAKTETIKRSKRQKGCPAHAPAGTRCKLCGQVHPQREGKSVKIHVPGDLEAKEDFK